MNQTEYEEKIYRQANMEWGFLDFWRMVLDDLEAGKICTNDFPRKNTISKKTKKKNIPNVKGRVRKLIDSNLKISEVAVKYGLKLEKNNKIICPFHHDTDPSLSFNDNMNVFFCFGCHATGDIIDFVGRLEDGQKRSN